MNSIESNRLFDCEIWEQPGRPHRNQYPAHVASTKSNKDIWIRGTVAEEVVTLLLRAGCRGVL